MIHVGIIGFGKMGRTRARAIREVGGAEVTAIYDPNPTLGPDVPPRAESAEAIFTDAAIDAVVICTPNYLNKPLTIGALEAGKHVFCEKPPAFTAADVEDIRAAEARSGRRLMYGFNHRHHESIQKMKQLIDGGEMGRVLWMRGRYGKEVDESFFAGWRAKKELAGGGIMLDQGIHMLDLFLYLGGGFDEVQAMVSNLFWKIDGIEDNVFANFRSRRTGLCASLHSTMTQWRYIFSLEVFLEHGALVLNGLKTSSGAYGDEDLAVKHNRRDSGRGTFDSEERLIYHTDTSWNSEVTHFFNSIERNQPVAIGNSGHALALMRLMDKIYGRARGPAPEDPPPAPSVAREPAPPR
ncbi:Gfo/Idh/MocA family oxidoreductase [bacterium]|nr:Gfo/Idh/MocA family oxidoreductase [bacterium]